MRSSTCWRLLIAITAKPSSWSHTIPTLRDGRDALFTSKKVCFRETKRHEIFSADLDERMASKDPDYIHTAFDLHRVPSFRARDDNSGRFQLRCRDCRAQQARAHQQSHIDLASPDFLSAANPANTGSRDRNPPDMVRSEEHTSELQSLTNLVCRLLLEKKK